MPTNDQPFFVYGTLKRRQIRESAWPVPPSRIVNAITVGKLYDLGAYPALTDCRESRDAAIGAVATNMPLVRGELWFIPAGGIAETLACLDEIEGYQDSANDLYRRELITAYALTDVASDFKVANNALAQMLERLEAHRAYTYFYAHAIEEDKRIAAGNNGLVSWPVE